MELPKRKQIQLKSHDYAENNLYFVTICTHHRQCLFGHIENGVMGLSPYGKIALAELETTREKREAEGILIEKSVIMPNHVHLLIHVGSRLAVTESQATN